MNKNIQLDVAHDPKFVFCPTYEEMSKRFVSKARYHLEKAKLGGPKGRQHLEDALAYSRVAQNLAAKHHEAILLRDWGRTINSTPVAIKNRSAA